MSVRRWERHWSITIRWDRAEHSPWRTTKYQTVVAKAAELRRLVEAARADRHVTAFPYEPVRVLVGEEPTHCPAGHVYDHDRRVAGRLVHRWAACHCCGHTVLVCDQPGCPAPQLYDPPVDNECEPMRPA